MRSNAAAKSASNAHRRLQVAPRAVTKIACIASWVLRPGRNPYDRDSNRASHSGSNALTVSACSARSAITGIPRPRRFPLPFGMNTRLTGRGLHASVSRCSQAAISAFSPPASTTLPSTPAVLRPALSSVTRRTLNRAFAREPSISFCRLRTRLRSPTCVAVKIRRRSRRTSSSTRRQSTASQSLISSSGPFTVTVSNLPIGSGVSDRLVFTGSPDPRQLPFGPGSTPVSDRLCASHPAEEPDRAVGGFPLPFGMSALASWVIQRLLGSCTFLTVGLPAQTTGPQQGCHVAHEQDSTGQDAPFTPGTVVRSRPATTLWPAPAAFQRPVPTAPLTHPIGGGHLHEASSGVHSRSPITPGTPDAAPEPGSTFASRRSSPCPRPPDGTGTASAWTPGFAPRSHPQSTPRRRQALTHWPEYYTYGINRTSKRCLLLPLMHPHVARNRRWLPSPPAAPLVPLGGWPTRSTTRSSSNASRPPAAVFGVRLVRVAAHNTPVRPCRYPAPRLWR